jgi:hypothetical protein
VQVTVYCMQIYCCLCCVQSGLEDCHTAGRVAAAINCAVMHLLQSGSYDFANARAAMVSPLAKKLFLVDGVTGEAGTDHATHGWLPVGFSFCFRQRSLVVGSYPGCQCGLLFVLFGFNDVLWLSAPILAGDATFVASQRGYVLQTPPEPLTLGLPGKRGASSSWSSESSSAISSCIRVKFSHQLVHSSVRHPVRLHLPARQVLRSAQPHPLSAPRASTHGPQLLF